MTPKTVSVTVATYLGLLAQATSAFLADDKRKGLELVAQSEDIGHSLQQQHVPVPAERQALLQDLWNAAERCGVNCSVNDWGKKSLAALDNPEAAQALQREINGEEGNISPSELLAAFMGNPVDIDD